MDSIEKIKGSKEHYKIKFKNGEGLDNGSVKLTFMGSKIPSAKVLGDMEKNKKIPNGFPVELEYLDGSKFEVEFAKDNKIKDVHSFRFGEKDLEYKKVKLPNGKGYQWEAIDGEKTLTLKGSENPAEPFIIENEKFWIYPDTFSAGKGNFIDNEGNFGDGNSTKAIFIWSDGTKQKGIFNKEGDFIDGVEESIDENFKSLIILENGKKIKTDLKTAYSNELLCSSYFDEKENLIENTTGYSFTINDNDYSTIFNYNKLNECLNEGLINNYEDLTKLGVLEIYKGEVRTLYENKNIKLDNDDIISIANSFKQEDNDVDSSIKYCLSECSKQILNKKIPNRNETMGLNSDYGELTKFLALANANNIEQIKSMRFPSSDIEESYSNPKEFFNCIGIAIDKIDSIKDKYLVLPLGVPEHAVTGAIDLETIGNNIEKYKTTEDPEKIMKDPKIFENALIIFDSSRYIPSELKGKREELGLEKDKKTILDCAIYPNRDVQGMGTCWLHSAISALSMTENKDLVKKIFGTGTKSDTIKSDLDISAMSLEQQSLELKHILKLHDFSINNGIEKVGLHNDSLEHKNTRANLARQITEPKIISFVKDHATELLKKLDSIEKLNTRRKNIENPGFLKATKALDIFIKNNLVSPEKIKKANLTKIKGVSEKLSEAFKEHDRKKEKVLGE